jgi:hypothetical protein
LLDLTSLGLFDSGIGDLSGLKWAVNLQSLSISSGSVSNLSVLSSLTNLTYLSLYGNLVRDISPLAGLTNLSYLDLGLNPVTNYTALAGLTNLATLHLEGNAISDLSFLTNLTGLVTLDLETNKITDVWPLVGLTNLNFLLLEQNRLTDIGALTNLPRLKYVDLRLNLIDLSTNTVIEVLQGQNTLVADVPQRSAPTIDVRTNWVVAAQTISSLWFNIWDSGAADQQFGVGVSSASPGLGYSLSPAASRGGNSLWTVAVTPTLPVSGSNSLNQITLVATNDVGLSSSVTVQVIVTDLLAVNGQLLGDPGASWTSGGGAPWFGQDIVSHLGQGVAQSGVIGNNQESWLQTTVTGPGRLSFWWKVSSEANYDWLEFEMLGQTNRISGEMDWQQQIANVPAGTQTLTWRYHKDGETSDGLDAGWLDQVAFEPGSWTLGLPTQADRQIIELTTVTVTNTAVNSNIPINLLAYQLLNAPIGAVIDTNGVISWTPSGAQAPSTNVITTTVSAKGVPGLNATNSFTVVANELNVTPVLPLIGPQVVNELTLLSVTNTATESDSQATVSYVLLAAPPGASISAGGVITWVPAQTRSSSTNIITTVATSTTPYDLINPQLSATNSFTVVVYPISPLMILLDPARLARGEAFEFLVLGPDARECMIQASTDLIVWSAVRTNTLTDGFFYFTELQPAMSPRRFFRAILLPVRKQQLGQAARQ